MHSPSEVQSSARTARLATPSSNPRASAHLEREAFFTAALEPNMAVEETADERPVMAGLKAEVEAADRRRARAETRILAACYCCWEGRAGKEQ